MQIGNTNIRQTPKIEYLFTDHKITKITEQHMTSKLCDTQRMTEPAS